jgi:ubiquinone/menaquinone biosynthesis C-methylase UbiE
MRSQVAAAVRSYTRHFQANESLAAFWDEAFRVRGHTGWRDQLVYRYDQPLRLRTVGRVVDRLFPEGLKHRRAMEIGCGTGDFIELLSRRGGSVLGLDISPQVISSARRRFASAPDVTLMTGAVAEAQLVPSSFDLITSITVLQHIVDDDELMHSLAVLRSALKRHGCMVVLELTPAHPAPVVIKEQSIVERPVVAWHEAFAKAGLRVLHEATLPQLGISMLRALERAVDANAAVTHAVLGRREQTGRVKSLLRGVLRAAFALTRSAILMLAWPSDHLLRLPLPRSSQRYYRLFVLGHAHVGDEPEAMHGVAARSPESVG